MNIRFRAVPTQTYALPHRFGRYCLKFQQAIVSLAAHEITFIFPVSLNRYNIGPCKAPAIGIKFSENEPNRVTTCRDFVTLTTFSPSLN